MTLTEFLLARIAEDEGVARRYLAEKVATYDGRDHGECHLRVLADCEAKRQIVNEYTDVLRWDTAEADDHGIHGQRLGLEFAVKQLAAVHADHPDYHEAWKP